MLLRAMLSGSVWNGCLLGKAKKEDVPCRFCAERDGDGHVFWECTFPPRELPEFASLMALDRHKWPQCLLWHGCGCLGFVVLVRGTLELLLLGSWHAVNWSVVCVPVLSMLLHVGLRRSTGTLMILLWRCLMHLIFRRMVVGRTSLKLVGLKWLVLVFMFLLVSLLFESAVWGVAEEYGDACLERCRAFMPVPGPLQPVQRAEFWGAIVALQSYWPCHFGIDNLNVPGSIGRLLDRGKPLPSVKDGDLVALVQYMIQAWGRDTVRVTKVKGHATDDDVEHGRVRLADKVGNAEADAAVDVINLN